MKCLTICQPYSELIAIGEKLVENRTWPTSHRGPLAIHAGKSEKWLGTHAPLPANMVFGAIIAVADVVECVRLDAHIPAKFAWVRTHAHASGPWCWILANVRRLAEPMPYRGQQGLFDVPDALVMPAESRTPSPRLAELAPHT